ncbi:hypothetical protein CFC21_079929 [Triticum aestivum]|uniref:Cytochrome P450 n=2 Tax=Triticum aestivum TaxID=4565 RepID=A0A3B6MXV7_WHEAT|nr:hypothetical protein CFC21_079929 [Triticum aestivum]
MELVALPLLGLLAFLLADLVVKRVYAHASPSPQKRLPPGPWQLPLIGSLHHVLLSRHDALPHRALRELAGRHGLLMLLRFGIVPMLVASSAEAAREVLKTHAAAFASLYMTHMLAVFTHGGQDVLFSPYGDLWHQLRWVCVLELISAQRIQSFRHIREDEAGGLLRSIANECARSRSDGAVVEIGERLARVVNNIVVRSASAVGSRCARREEFLHELDEITRLTASNSLPDLFPSSTLVRWLGSGLREAEQCNRNAHDILGDICIRERAEGGQGSGDDGEDDLLGVLLRVRKEDGGVKCAVTTDAIITVVLEVFATGNETSATTLEWAMSEIVKEPRLLCKVQAEVREVFKGQQKLTEGDMGKLSYLHLVIKETPRLHTPVPFLLPRQCREACEVMGYHVPEGTRVLVNAWAMARDGAYWEDAEVFKPERFEEGRAATVDFRGGDIKFIHFGAGSRMCPGIALGLANMELVLAGLLYHFDWELPDGGRPEELDMAEVFGLAIRRKSGLVLVLRATQRIPVAN